MILTKIENLTLKVDIVSTSWHETMATNEMPGGAFVGDIEDMANDNGLPIKAYFCRDSSKNG